MYNIGVKSFKCSEDIKRGQIVMITASQTVGLYIPDYGYPFGMAIDDSANGSVPVWTKGRTFEIITGEAVEVGDGLAYDATTATWVEAGSNDPVMVALTANANPYGGMVEAAFLL